MTIGPHLLGRTLEHDPASRGYEHHIRRITKPRNKTHLLAGPHLNQADLGSCEGNTSAEFLNCGMALKNRKLFNDRNPRSGQASVFAGNKFLTEDQAVDLYSKATTLDNDEIPGHYPPTDTGTSGNGIAKAMRAMGGLQTYNWTFTWDAFLATLQTQPIMLGLNWYTDMFDTDSKGRVHRGGKVEGGHAILAFSVQFTGSHAAQVGCTNHWVNDDGSIWGVKIGKHEGCFWISFADLEQLLIHEQGDSLVPVLM